MPHPLQSTSLTTATFPLGVEGDRAERAQADAGPAAGALGRVDEGRARLELDGAAVDQRQGLRRGRAGLGHGVRDVLRALAGAGEEDAVGERGHGGELRVPLGEEALASRS